MDEDGDPVGEVAVRLFRFNYHPAAPGIRPIATVQNNPAGEF